MSVGTDDGFHARLRSAREAAGMNQSELARAMEVRPQSVQQWESTDPERRTTPRGPRLIRLADILGVSERWLRLGQGEMRSKPPANVREGSPNFLGYMLKNPAASKEAADRPTRRRDERPWWQHEVRKVSPVELSGYWDKHMSIGDMELMYDYASPKLVADITVAPDTGPGSTLLITRGLFNLAAAVRMGERLMIERRYVLFVAWNDEPNDQTRRENMLLPLKRRASLFDIEVIDVRQPDEIAEKIAEIEGIIK